MAIVELLQSFLQKRTTRLLFNGAKSNTINISTGILQGSPLSLLFYMYYNAELLEVQTRHDPKAGLSLGFIDDIIYRAEETSARSNAKSLEYMLQGAEAWRWKHGAQFERLKYILIHFTRNRQQLTDASVKINSTVIRPSKEAKYLRVTFDQQLHFKAHVQQAVKKGTNAALALNWLANTNWRAPYKLLCQLYEAVVARRLDYASVIWYQPKADRSMSATAQNRKFTTVQLIAISP